ncbi:MAG: hypothetical protein HS103_05275 [Anaerolineales bacterium]|nr:hypothetical protein [Anaerolineales bacterium]
MRFIEQLGVAQIQQGSRIALGIVPHPPTMPAALARYDDPFFPYGKAVIEATRDHVCAYVVHLSAYLAHGGAGAVALERTLAYVPAPLLRILHAPFATGEYVRAAFEDSFGAHAVTIAAGTPVEDIRPYLAEEQHGVFLHAADRDHISALAEAFPGQVGVYHGVGRTAYECELVGTFPTLKFHWTWGDPVFTPRPAGEDYAAGWRNALRDLARRVK